MRMSRLLVGAAAAVLLVAYAATPAGAVWDPGLAGPKADRSQHRSELTSTGPARVSRGGSIRGPAVRPKRPYPSTGTARAGFVSNDEGFAGIIHATPIGGGTDCRCTASTS